MGREGKGRVDGRVGMDGREGVDGKEGGSGLGTWEDSVEVGSTESVEEGSEGKLVAHRLEVRE